MPLYHKLPDDLKEVDVLIAGADPTLSVLVIEQGPNNYGIPEVVHPALYPKNLVQSSKTALFWQGNPAPQLAGRHPVFPSGGTLGGGSSINWRVYTRAQRCDFDSWDTPGWSADELYPHLKNFEKYHGKGEREHHGDNGPVNVSGGTHRSKRAEDGFIDAAAQLGYQELRDLQNLDATNATERWLKYIGPSGRRQDAAHRFVHPKLRSGEYPHLHVLVEKQVVKVLLDANKRAVGVECRTNPKFQPNPEFQWAQQTHRQVRARKLVVVSAGANATPLILERSGIGDSQVLERAGVPVVEDLPGVGNDYQDHHLTLCAYRTHLKPRETINGFIGGRFDVEEAIRNNDELLGTNAMDASGKVRPTEEEHLGYFADHSTLPDSAEYISMANWTAYPYSRGHIHITGPSISDEPDFDVGYLNDDDDDDIDVKKHIWAYKIQREIMRRMSIFAGELATSHPQFPAGSKAAVVEKADGPIARGAGRLQYSCEDEEAIERKVRETVSTTWHSLGTCKMAPREAMGVVDARLNVHGIIGLKLADLSIPAENVGANTGNAAFVVGEKAADIIIGELELGKDRARL
ncbi:alcohol oxidase [Teratosphaeria nubilosa]|uniref:Alcohol oxidase n=1 Tax=Teratosphaeria nubilosa TaxID=161662 RepID=A0A6G1LGF5_9PEZI|nr:alcohol oxidase [Teratosphaeria nubilosa]